MAVKWFETTWAQVVLSLVQLSHRIALKSDIPQHVFDVLACANDTHQVHEKGENSSSHCPFH